MSAVPFCLPRALLQICFFRSKQLSMCDQHGLFAGFAKTMVWSAESEAHWTSASAPGNDSTRPGMLAR